MDPSNGAATDVRRKHQIAAAKAFTIKHEAEGVSRQQCLTTLQKLPEFAGLGHKTHLRWMTTTVKQQSGPKVNSEFEKAVTSFLVLKVMHNMDSTPLDMRRNELVQRAIDVAVRLFSG